MKRFFFTLVLTVMAMCASAAVGDTFSVGNLSYGVTSTSSSSGYPNVMVLGLSDEGKAATDLRLHIPGTVAYNGIRYSVYAVGPSAFAGATNIKTVQARWGVGAIWNNAFEGCKNITYAQFASSVKYIFADAFKDCTALKDVYMANPDPATGCSYAATAFPTNTSMRLFVTKAADGARLKYKDHEAFSQFSTVSASSLAYDMYFSDGAYLCVTKDPTRTTVGEMTLVGYNVNGTQDKAGVFAPSCGSANYGFETRVRDKKLSLGFNPGI